MEIRRCMKCMHELKPGETTCPECGTAYGSWRTESFALKPGTILDGKYLVGEMLGQGGFGITYIGFDLLLEQKVAIKEYFPMSTGMVSRENQSSVVWSSTMMEKTGAEKGFDSFLKEARKMAKLGDIPNVVGVKSVFIQNETAYIVMDFIEGETLQRKLQREGPMEFDICVSLLTPIMEALEQVHQHGIIHRDISPDNLMVRKDGRLVLLDLGAAKDLDIQAADGTMQSSQLVAKQGFSPIEQYGRSGKIGPWTDVYAMAATIYYCCTGKLPPSATDRAEDDTLCCQPLLAEEQFDALATCMTLSAKQRPQSMEDMLKSITQVSASPETTPKKPGQPPPEPPAPNPPFFPKPMSPLPKWLIPVAAGIAVLCIAVSIGVCTVKKPNTALAPLVTTAPTESTAAQNVSTENVPVEVYVMAAAEDLSQIDYDARDEQFFWGQSNYKRKDVETVMFQSTLSEAPDGAWDISEAGDQTIVAWMDGGNLHVAANGKIAPNPNASWLFAFFSNLKKIDFGDCFDTSNVTHMKAMFYKCKSLTSLDVSNFDTANVADMRDMVGGCSSLTSLDVSGFDVANVTNMWGMFAECSSLTSLDVSKFDTANVTSMGYMFWNCSSLTSLDVSGFDTTNVWTMHEMFSGCSNLTSLDVSGFNTPNVTNMGGLFSGCRSLIQLDVSGFDTADVTDMSSMFRDCSSLTELDVSGFDTSNVTDMAAMFNMCDSLTKLDVSQFNTSKVTTMAAMFQACSELTELDVSGFDTSNVADMSVMFRDCSSLAELTCSDGKLLAEYRNR